MDINIQIKIQMNIQIYIQLMRKHTQNYTFRWAPSLYEPLCVSVCVYNNIEFCLCVSFVTPWSWVLFVPPPVGAFCLPP